MRRFEKWTFGGAPWPPPRGGEVPASSTWHPCCSWCQPCPPTRPLPQPCQKQHHQQTIPQLQTRWPKIQRLGMDHNALCLKLEPISNFRIIKRQQPDGSKFTIGSVLISKMARRLGLYHLGPVSAEGFFQNIGSTALPDPPPPQIFAHFLSVPPSNNGQKNTKPFWPVTGGSTSERFREPENY